MPTCAFVALVPLCVHLIAAGLILPSVNGLQVFIILQRINHVLHLFFECFETASISDVLSASEGSDCSYPRRSFLFGALICFVVFSRARAVRFFFGFLFDRFPCPGLN